MDRKAKVFILEGISGSGKTTQLDKVKRFLEGRGQQVVEIVEPSDEVRRWAVEYKKRPDRDPYVELAKFQADRIAIYEREMEQRLTEENLTFLLGRSFLSTLVYQGIMGGVPLELIDRMNRFYPKPDLAFIFDCDPATALARIESDTTRTRTGTTADEKLRKMIILRAGYVAVAGTYDYARIIEAGGTESDTFSQIEKELRRSLDN